MICSPVKHAYRRQDGKKDEMFVLRGRGAGQLKNLLSISFRNILDCLVIENE